MNCPFCDTPFAESSAFCSGCGKKLKTTTTQISWSGDPEAIAYVQAVGKKLATKSFKVNDFTSESNSEQRIALLAVDEFEYGHVVPNLRHVVFASIIQRVDGREDIGRLRTQCIEFAMRNFRHQGLVSIPVAVSRKFPHDLMDWIANDAGPNRYGVIEFPVLASIDSRGLTYLRKTPAWGWLYYRKVRKFADEILQF